LKLSNKFKIGLREIN